MRRLLPRLGGLLRDIWYGLDAAAAIRHGSPVPEDPRAATRRAGTHLRDHPGAPRDVRADPAGGLRHCA